MDTNKTTIEHKFYPGDRYMITGMDYPIFINGVGVDASGDVFYIATGSTGSHFVTHTISEKHFAALSPRKI